VIYHMTDIYKIQIQSLYYVYGGYPTQLTGEDWVVADAAENVLRNIMNNDDFVCLTELTTRIFYMFLEE